MNFKLFKSNYLSKTTLLILSLVLLIKKMIILLIQILFREVKAREDVAAKIIELKKIITFNQLLNL